MADIESGDRFDYVIVGAGSAGLRAGEPAERRPERHASRCWRRAAATTSLLVRMPAGASQLFDNKNPIELGVRDRRRKASSTGGAFIQPRGRGWGGSSSINAMIYIRGHARDYDQWRQMGLTGWGYADVLPYFKRAQQQ